MLAAHPHFIDIRSFDHSVSVESNISLSSNAELVVFASRPLPSREKVAKGRQQQLLSDAFDVIVPGISWGGEDNICWWTSSFISRLNHP